MNHNHKSTISPLMALPLFGLLCALSCGKVSTRQEIISFINTENLSIKTDISRIEEIVFSKGIQCAKYNIARSDKLGTVLIENMIETSDWISLNEEENQLFFNCLNPKFKSVLHEKNVKTVFRYDKAYSGVPSKYFKIIHILSDTVQINEIHPNSIEIYDSTSMSTDFESIDFLYRSLGEDYYLVIDNKWH